jgi:hypothetical protein
MVGDIGSRAGGFATGEVSVGAADGTSGVATGCAGGGSESGRPAFR